MVHANFARGREYIIEVGKPRNLVLARFVESAETRLRPRYGVRLKHRHGLGYWRTEEYRVFVENTTVLILWWIPFVVGVKRAEAWRRPQAYPKMMTTD
jgi:hypothetical protein